MEATPVATLRSELQALLAEKHPDFGRVLQLSQQLAEHDQKFVRFSADSGLISRLGEQLVARQETAVSELVKNAYDADATTVRLIFAGTDRPGGRLHLRDDGSGMTREEIINGFMRLASTAKINEPQSLRYHRQRAGRKGIGRFAAQRLGIKLTLLTQTESASNGFKVEIDWRMFEHGRELSTIPSRIQEIPKERPHGTTLIIDGLREAFSDKQIERIYQYVQDLIQPYPIARLDSNKKDKGDPGFTVSICRLVGAKEVEIAGADKMVFNHAAAQIGGTVDNEGEAVWWIKSKRFRLDEDESLSASKKTPNVAFLLLRNVSFSAYHFIWGPEAVPPLVEVGLKKLVQSRAGIRLYRNGFRVLPYGEPGNDWLGLDETSRKRSVLVSIANVNWVGFVEIRDPEGALFEETSSREGLLQNTAYDELVGFVSRSLQAAVLRLAAARGKKGKAGRNRKDALPPNERLKRVAVDLDDLAGKMVQNAAKRGDRPGPEVLVLRDVANRIREEASASAELIQEAAMLRILGGLGLTIGVFIHEVRHRLLALSEELRDLVESSSVGKAKSRPIETIGRHVDLLQSYTAYFDAAISANVRRDLEPQNLGVLLWDFIREFRPVVERDHIEFADPDIREEDELLTRPMHPSEWTSILTNLLTNAIKAIRRSRDSGKGRLLLKAWREENTLFVDFADNGVGISEENEERIFDAFFTTTGDNDDGLTGTGLGLKIVRDILAASEGQIYITPAPKGYKTCFRIEVPGTLLQDIQ